MATASILWRGADKFEIIARRSYDDYNQSNGLLATLVDSNASVGGNIPLEYVSGSISSMIMNTYSGMYTFKGRAGSWSFSAQFRGRATRAALPILKVFWRFGTEEDNKKIAEDSVVAWAEGGASAMNAFLESQGWSYVFERQLPLPLSTPTGLNADQITSNSATIGWTAVTNATSYQITCTPSGGTSTTVTSATNSVVLTNLSGATSYSVEVVAVGDGTTYTDSSSSSALTFTTLQKLATPTGLKVTNNAVITTKAKQTVTWNTVANATGYKLEYKQSTSTTWSSVTRTDTTAIFPNRTRNVSYDHRITALGDGTTYNDSDTSSVVTKKSKQQLATPTGLTCTNKTATSLTFSWNEVSGTKTYNLGYKLPSASSYSYVYASSSPATITGLTAGTTYQVYISARTPTDSTNYDGSAYTSPVSIATLAQLSAPTGLTHDRVTSTSARVGWNAVENASDYKVEYRRQGDTTWNE